MEPLANLQTVYNNIAALLVTATANPMPSYSVQGVSISWSDYVAMLTDQLNKIQDQIIVQSGPYELITQAVS